MSSKIYIVGMGPGTGDMMTPQADHALCGSDVIVGYPVGMQACMEWHPCSMRCRKRIRDVNLR